MTINNGDSGSSTFTSGAIFVHDFIHKLESDLGVNITFTSHDDPDTLEFDVTGGDITLTGLDPLVFGVTEKTLTASDNKLEMIKLVESQPSQNSNLSQNLNLSQNPNLN